MENAKLRILLADDDEGDRLVFKVAFQEMGEKHNVQMVQNGLQLMDYLKKNSALLPELIFLDLNMPCKGGMECLREIRKEASYNAISIIIYSTSASEKDIEETFNNGANQYIRKPCSFEKLKQLLANAVGVAPTNMGKSCKRANYLLSS